MRFLMGEEKYEIRTIGGRTACYWLTEDHRVMLGSSPTEQGAVDLATRHGLLQQPAIVEQANNRLAVMKASG